MQSTGALSGGDIRYRGIFTYRGLRLVALVIMTLSALAKITLTTSSFVWYLGIDLLTDWQTTALTILQRMGQVTFPLMMFSTFTTIRNKQEEFGKLLLNYFVLALLTYLAIALVLANVIKYVIYSLPEAFPELANALKIREILAALMKKTVSLVLPGDGTIHLDILNESLSRMNVSFSFPDWETLSEILTQLGISKEEVSAIVSLADNIDYKQISTLLVDYLVNLLKNMSPENAEFMRQYVMPLILNVFVSRLNMNIYWDLLLYSLAYYFICSKPKRICGGKVLLFRSLAAIPLCWMLISFIVSGNLRALATISVSPWFTGLMTKQSPATMLIFFLFILFEKYNELEFVEKYGNNEEELDRHMDTRRTSLRFSIAASVTMILVSLLDWALGQLPAASNWKLGSSTSLWMAVPFLMLFCFNKKPKHKVFDLLIPLYYVLHCFILLMAVGLIIEQLNLFLQ